MSYSRTLKMTPHLLPTGMHTTSPIALAQSVLTSTREALSC